MADHDQSYRLLFSHPEMIRDLLVGFVREPWVREIDFSTLERCPGSYVSHDLQRREADLLWRARWRGRRLYIYLLLELQSRPERFMALRMLVYLGLLYQDLVKAGELSPGGKLPPVLPLVLYNGERPWKAPRRLSELLAEVPGLERFQPRLEYLLIDEQRWEAAKLEGLRNLAAALFRLEKSRGPEEVQRVVAALARWLEAPEQASLRRAFIAWIRGVLLPARVPEASLETTDDLQELRTMLQERVKEWTVQWKQEGLEAGRREGRREGLQEGLRKGLREGEAQMLARLLERKFGPVSPEIQGRLKAAGAEELLVWGERLLTADRLDDVFAPAEA